MTQEKVTDIISASSEALTAVDGIITSIYKSHMRKYERADNYLATVILEKGTVSDEDVNIAAQLYGIPMLRKKYRNIAKTLNKAYLEGEYIENHYKIMIVRQSLCVSPRFLRETQAVQQSAVKDGVQ